MGAIALSWINNTEVQQEQGQASTDSSEEGDHSGVFFPYIIVLSVELLNGLFDITSTKEFSVEYLKVGRESPQVFADYSFAHFKLPSLHIFLKVADLDLVVNVYISLGKRKEILFKLFHYFQHGHFINVTE